MSLTMRDIYLALQGLDCAVTRGWPQALIPLPAIAISGFMDSLDERGERRFAVDLTLRAPSPEGADSLALEVEEALAPLHLRRSGSKDGAEKDRDSFTKALRYEKREPPADASSMEITLTIDEASYTARLISMSSRRRLTDISRVDDRAPRLMAAGEEYSRLKVRLPGALFNGLQAHYALGEAVLAMGKTALIESCSLMDGETELTLCRSL